MTSVGKSERMLKIISTEIYVSGTLSSVDIELMPSPQEDWSYAKFTKLIPGIVADLQSAGFDIELFDRSIVAPHFMIRITSKAKLTYKHVEPRSICFQVPSRLVPLFPGYEWAGEMRTGDQVETTLLYRGGSSKQ